MARTVGVAVESGRAVLRCRFYGPTTHRGSRIKVQRFDALPDPNRVTVAWDHSLGLVPNYVAAVQAYLDRAEWSGSWVVSTVTDGAVAMYVPSTDRVTLLECLEARKILDECEMTHLLIGSAGHVESDEIVQTERTWFGWE